MTKEAQKQLIADHFLFKEGDRFLKEANASTSVLKFKINFFYFLDRYWPAGRGIFHNAKKAFFLFFSKFIF